MLEDTASSIIENRTASADSGAEAVSAPDMIVAAEKPAAVATGLPPVEEKPAVTQTAPSNGDSAADVVESAAISAATLGIAPLVENAQQLLQDDPKKTENQKIMDVVEVGSQGLLVADGVGVTGMALSGHPLTGATAVMAKVIVPLAVIATGADAIHQYQTDNPAGIGRDAGALGGGLVEVLAVGAIGLTGPVGIVAGIGLAALAAAGGGELGKEFLTEPISDLMGIKKDATADGALPSGQPAGELAVDQPLLPPVEAPVAVTRADLAPPDFLSARSANGGSPATLKSLQSAVATSSIAPVIDRRNARAMTAQLKRFQAQENGPGKHGFHAETLTLGDEKIMISEGRIKGDDLIHIGMSDKDGAYHELRTVKRGAEETKVMKQMQASLKQGTFTLPTA